jgi:hypothetical protein
MVFLYCLAIPVSLLIIKFQPFLEWVKNAAAFGID